MALKKAAKELIWLKLLFKQIPFLNNYKSNLLFYNNKSVINLFKNPEHYACTKYINIQYHFIRDCIKQEFFNLVYINTKEQLADALTKPLNITSFKNFIQNINIDKL